MEGKRGGGEGQIKEIRKGEEKREKRLNGEKRNKKFNKEELETKVLEYQQKQIGTRALRA